MLIIKQVGLLFSLLKKKKKKKRKLKQLKVNMSKTYKTLRS